jgi:hypothetical protein
MNTQFQIFLKLRQFFSLIINGDKKDFSFMGISSVQKGATIVGDFLANLSGHPGTNIAHFCRQVHKSVTRVKNLTDTLH